MLALTRLGGERLLIGDNIVVQVVAAHGGRARIALVAPPSVPIVREGLDSKVDARILLLAGPRKGRHAAMGTVAVDGPGGTAA